jgi:pyruvate/2-oxoglutarate dehydrogenase complex dihydrolipoamide dehydrogenase (E3) component
VSQGGQDIRLLANHAVVLAAGTTAFIPPIEGLREALPWTSRDATNVAEVPERLVILGGGVVACESATWMAALGSEVTLVARSLLLPKNEPFAGELVARNLQKAGVKVLLRTSAESVSRQDPAASGEGRVHGGKVTVSIEGQDDIMADEIIVAAGRSPATAGLNLESVGLKSGGFVQADDRLTAQGDWLYAAGDINGKALLTHMGKYQGRLCGAIIAARAAGRSLDSNRFKILAPLAVPQVTFTDPEVASVGLTRREAQEQGFQVEDFEYDLAWIAGSSLLRDDYLGRANMIVDTNTNCLLGVTFVGTGVAELVHSATVAIVGRVPLDVLWHAVPSYPTVSEIWLRLLEAWNAKHFQTN